MLSVIGFSIVVVLLTFSWFRFIRKPENGVFSLESFACLPFMLALFFGIYIFAIGNTLYAEKVAIATVTFTFFFWLFFGPSRKDFFGAKAKNPPKDKKKSTVAK